MTDTKKFLLNSLVFLLLASNCFAQDTVRIMTYNILRYPDHSESRNEHLARAVRTADPDVLVCEEMKSQSGVDLFLDKVLTRDYTAGTFRDGNGFDTDNAIYYKHSIIEFIEHTQFYADPRRISQFKIVHKQTADTLIIYGVHLKASQGADNETRRNDSAQKLRDVTDEFNEGKNFILVGDFNIYRSSEPAYQTLLDQENSGYFLDPIDSPGNWHNSFAFRSIHTQSTRTNQLSDGGASGGLDDRFDMILISQGIKDEGGIDIIPESYTAYGNDGGHFNSSINVQPNDAVPELIADALYYGSDHLPVYADFLFGAVSDIDDSVPAITGYELHQNYPNPFNPTTTISFISPDKKFVELTVYNIMGQKLSTLFSGYPEIGYNELNFNADGLPSGVYFYHLKAGQFSSTRKMILLQ